MDTSHCCASESRSHHCTVALNHDTVLIMGGVINDEGRITNTCLLFRLSLNQFHKSKQMILRRQNHAAVVLPDGSVLISGGSCEVTFSSCEMYVPGHPDKRRYAGRMRQQRECHALCVLPNTRTVLAIGGNPRLTGYSFCETFNMDTLRWSRYGPPVPDVLYEADAVVLLD